MILSDGMRGFQLVAAGWSGGEEPARVDARSASDLVRSAVRHDRTQLTRLRQVLAKQRPGWQLSQLSDGEVLHEIGRLLASGHVAVTGVSSAVTHHAAGGSGHAAPTAPPPTAPPPKPPPKPTAPPRPGAIDVTVTRSDTGAALEGVQLRVTGPANRDGRSGHGTGVASFELLRPGDYQVEVALAGQLADDFIAPTPQAATVTPDSRTPVTFALRPAVHQLTLVEVVQHGGATQTQSPHTGRQFVNLDAAVDPSIAHYDFGRVLHFKAFLERLEPDGSHRPLSGHPLYFYAKPGGGNRQHLVHALREGFDAAGSAQLHKQASTGGDGWTPVVSFSLSRYGGDTFQVFVTEDAGYKGGIDAGPYTVWRKVFYELTCMTRSTGPGNYSAAADTAGMEGKLAGVYAVAEQVGATGTPAHQRVVTESEAAAWVSANRSADGKARAAQHRYYQLALIDTIAWDPSNHDETFRLPAGTHTIALDAAKYTLDPRNWLVAASYRQGTAAWSTLPSARLTLAETGDPASGNDGYSVTIDFTGQRLDPAHPVDVRLRLRSWSEGSGLQSGLAVIVGMRWRERSFAGADLSNSTLNTMLHEPGHFLGLASSTFPDGKPCPTTYQKAGGHCNYNTNTCVMYEANSTHTDFCPNCSDAVRGRNLDSLPVGGTAAFT